MGRAPTNRDEHLKGKIERALVRLLDGKVKAEEAEQLVKIVNVGTKYLAVKGRLGEQDWGSGLLDDKEEEE